MNEQVVRYLELDLKLEMGHKTLNILNISHEPPRPGWSYDQHSHSSYELHFIPEGYGTLQTSTRQYRLSPGIFYMTGPGISHHQQADAALPMREYCLNFELLHTRKRATATGALIAHEAEELFSALAQTPFWFGAEQHGCMALFEHMLRELDSQQMGRYTNIRSLCSLIVINALRHFSPHKNDSPYGLPLKVLDDARRFKVDQFFLDYHRPLRPQELADQLGVTERQLHRILMQYYGLSFSEKLKQTRLDHVCHLLRTTDQPLAQIAERSGFSSISYLHRLFRKREGCTPLAYRNRMPPAIY